MKPWKRINPTEVTKVGWRTIVTKTFELPDGKTATFGTKDAENARAVAVIALTKANQVVVVNSYRPGPEKLMQEIPGGGVDGDESLVEAAKRELKEETGYKVGTITALGECHYDAYTNGERHYFLARDCELTDEGATPDEYEFLTVEEISVSALTHNAMSARMTDPGAVLLAYDQLQEIAAKQA